MTDVGKGIDPPIRFSVLTVSDRCYRNEAVDEAGPTLRHVAAQRLGGELVDHACVPDDAETITARLGQWAHGPSPPDLLLTTGGTGLAPRDVTPEATAAVLDRKHPGLVQLMHMRCYRITARALLSRGVAGTIGRTLVINLPGSRKGARESLEALTDVLPHAVETLRGDGDPHA